MSEQTFGICASKSLEEKLNILADAAKYDVACTSSGVDRKGKKGMLGNSVAAGICHSFAGDGRCISLLKILMTNHCIYDCKYCINRCSNDVERAIFTPQEICELTIEFYKRNYIEGLFLSSGVVKNPAYTMEKICEALRLLRTKYAFNGYIHVKAIPGAPAELIYSAGLLADRISVNMELPTENGLRTLAPNKSMNTIMRPMAQIADTIAANRLSLGKNARMERSGINRHLGGSIFNDNSSGYGRRVEGSNKSTLSNVNDCKPTSLSGANIREMKSFDVFTDSSAGDRFMYPAERIDAMIKRPFALAGQSTQVIIGATAETDFDLVRMSQRLYQNMDLKRVFYSAYIPINDDPLLPEIGTSVPLLREHRLYQSDWLLRFYGFKAEELLSEENPNFDERLDPKCFWALNHLDRFPVEINTASYDALIRVPGIGPKGVKQIMTARRSGRVTFEMLKKMRIVLKRAQYFITCSGKMLSRIPFEQKFITDALAGAEYADNYRITDSQNTYQQLDLFADFGLSS